ncbi:hypothetical protein [Wenjunlia vitaminophila]|uniref:hypothetical protein n=1 Tax=Wenjunlia vitaminophila TaxID=76728 RepID=UPI0012FECDBD|nr:hypothetical protein [Wenjunlia vitaminophila]
MFSAEPGQLGPFGVELAAQRGADLPQFLGLGLKITDALLHAPFLAQPLGVHPGELALGSAVPPVEQDRAAARGGCGHRDDHAEHQRVIAQPGAAGAGYG